MALRDHNQDDWERHKEALAQDDRQHIARGSWDLLTNAGKAIVTLNSGGLVAMLGFAQALAGKPQAAGFKWFAIGAMCLFLTGACTAALSFFSRHQQLGVELSAKEKLAHRLRASQLMKGGVLAFGSGVVIVILGIAIAF